MEAVRGHLLLTNCLEDELTRPNIELALKADRLLWLDLEGTDDEVLTLLHEVFKIHPLAVEDVREFHQRPKIEDYDDFVSIVVYGARSLGEPLTEVHCFYAERFLVSVHRDEVPAVADACHTLGRLHTDRRLVALYRLLDALVDTMFPYLTAMDRNRAVNLADYSLALGRRFRSLKLWFVLRSFGREGIAEVLRRHIRIAKEVADKIAQHPDFELAAPVDFSLVCFRHRSSDAANRALLEKVNQSGEALLSGTTLNGNFVLRMAIGNLATGEEDVRKTWELIQRLA